jgi:hypothetical protein
MFVRRLLFTCALLLTLASVAYPQLSEETTIIPLVVEKGFPLQVALTESLSLKKNELVHARVTEAVYSFDREVIPAGTEVEGRIIGFEKVGKWKRVSAMLGGDFTPLRNPKISFHTLILKDGTRIPINTAVEPGPEKTVGHDGDRSRKDLKNALTSTPKQSAGSKVKNFLWGMSPYHPRSLAVGTSLNAILDEPLDFGVAVLGNDALQLVGTQLPEDAEVSVRLTTALDSGTAKIGMPIEAVLTRPVFSSGHQLIFPVGSSLRGEVINVNHARSFHRNGQLAFMFTSIEPPAMFTLDSTTQQAVDGTLVSAEVGHDMRHLHIHGNGTRIVESKTRFVGPAWAFIKVDRAVGATADSFDEAVLGAYRGKFLKQAVGQESSTFGLPASISGAMIPPVGITLGIVGAARSVYSNLLGPGRNIVLPANTPMQIRLSSAVPEAPITSQEDTRQQ